MALQAQLLVTIGIICATVCAFVAPVRNRSTVGWTCAGFFFGGIAILLLAVLPKGISRTWVPAQPWAHQAWNR